MRRLWAWRHALPLPVRLALVIVTLVGGGLVLVVWQTAIRLRPSYASASEEALVDTATVLAAWCSTAQRAGRDPAVELSEALSVARGRRLNALIHGVPKTALGLTVYLTDAQGTVLYHSTDPTQVGLDYSQWNDVLRTLRGGYGARATRSDPTDERTAVLHVAAPVMVDGRLTGVLTVAKPVDAVTPFADLVRSNLIDLALGILVLAALAALAAAAWVARPLRRLTAHVVAVKAGGRPPLPELGRGELGTLAGAFDDLRAALDGRAQVERYMQTLTHELKGPLAAISGAAELLAEDPPTADRARFLANVRAEAGRMQTLIEALLHLATLERAEALAHEPVLLAALLDDVIAGFGSVAAVRGVVLTSAVPVGLTITGDRFWLRQGLANLTHNAIEFAPLGSVIELHARVEGDSIRLLVADRGPGIPDWARARIFERFFSLPRPDTGRRSSGLGLTIAREIAVRHGGGLTLTERPGGGTVAELSIPR